MDQQSPLSEEQRNSVFEIRDLNLPWREVLDMGVRSSRPRFHNFTDSDTDADAFYFLDRGSLQLSCISAAGQERVIMYIRSGNVFSELSVLHRSFWPLHSLRTLEECSVIRFERRLLDDPTFCAKYPHLMANLVHSLGIKAGAFFSQVSEAYLFDAKTQICHLLYHLASRNHGEKSFNPGISQAEMASLLGLHRSSVCRAVRELREAGIIGRFTKTSLEILALERLEQLAGIIRIGSYS